MFGVSLNSTPSVAVLVIVDYFEMFEIQLLGGGILQSLIIK